MLLARSIHSGKIGSSANFLMTLRNSFSWIHLQGQNRVILDFIGLTDLLNSFSLIHLQWQNRAIWDFC